MGSGEGRRSNRHAHREDGPGVLPRRVRGGRTAPKIHGPARPANDLAVVEGAKDFADFLALDDSGRARALRQIGRPRETVVRATIESAALFEELRDQLAARLSPNDSEDTARRKIREWGERVDASADLANIIWRTNATTQLAGQLFVRDIELGDRVRKLEATGETAGSFLNLPFTEAIRHFEGRNILSPEEFDALLDQERSRSFTVRRAISEGVMRDAFARLAAAMQPGGPGLGEFIRDMGGGVDADGYPGGVRRYLENVYRTTTATSYNAGRYRQQTDPDVLAADDLWWIYRTAGDTRVRPEHAALEGKAWLVGDAEGASVYPPNSYQCRCVMTVTDEKPDASALSRDVSAADAVTDGFRGTPGAAIENEA